MNYSPKLTQPDIDQFNLRHEKAFDKVFYCFFDEIYYYSRLKLEDRHDARSITINTFFKVWISKQKFKEEDNLKAYLYVAADNEYKDFVKSRKRYRKALQNYRDHLAVESLQNLVDQYETETIKALKEVISKLDEKYGDVAKLHYEEGLTNKEIAVKLNISLNNVSQLKRYAIKKIKEFMLKQKLFVAVSVTAVSTHYSSEIFEKIAPLFSFFRRIVVFLLG